MKWFRMYHEARKDVKLNSLTALQFRVWFKLMCLACECEQDGVIPLRSDRIMALEVADGDVQLYRETISILEELEMLEIREKELRVIPQDWFDYGSELRKKMAERSRVDRKAIFERDGYRCHYCGTDVGPFEVDHVIPLSRGGTSDPGNLVVACRKCNQSKRDKTPAEWIGLEAVSHGLD